MTAREFLVVARQRWYVVVLGLLATVMSLSAVQHAAPVYWSRASLLVLAPAKMSDGNVLQDNAPVAVAGLAVMDVTGRPLVLRAARADATLYGLGEYSGVLIQVRNSGGQWTPSASSPYIDIEATDSDPITAERQVRQGLQRIRAAVERRQEEMQVSPAYRASLEQTPPMVSVAMISPDRRRALGATLLTGVALTAMAVAVVERLLRRRSTAPSLGPGPVLPVSRSKELTT
jgi:hypothetical protein